MPETVIGQIYPPPTKSVRLDDIVVAVPNPSDRNWILSHSDSDKILTNSSSWERIQLHAKRRWVLVGEVWVNPTRVLSIKFKGHQLFIETDGATNTISANRAVVIPFIAAARLIRIRTGEWVRLTEDAAFLHVDGTLDAGRKTHDVARAFHGKLRVMLLQKGWLKFRSGALFNPERIYRWGHTKMTFVDGSSVYLSLFEQDALKRLRDTLEWEPRDGGVRVNVRSVPCDERDRDIVAI